MNNKAFLIIFFPIVLIILVYFWWQIGSGQADKNNQTYQDFKIEKGESTDTIIDKLYKNGLIKNKTIFKLIIKKENLEGKIQAGDFQLSPSQNAQEIARKLTHGTSDVWLVIPEGLRREEIYQIIKNAGLEIDYDAWLEQTENQEGYLFPDTYKIPKDIQVKTLIDLMTANFDQKTSVLGKLNQKQIIQASLVEREVKTDQDRPMVAGIIAKRLINDWPLEIDATVQYAIGSQKSWWPEVTADDLLINSQYNTRKFPGLPPSPICNPGLASLKAIVNPQESDYWFYLSDKKGNIHYGKTLEEHEQNIAKYLD